LQNQTRPKEFQREEKEKKINKTRIRKTKKEIVV
jgi:hypothetical protein